VIRICCILARLPDGGAVILPVRATGTVPSMAVPELVVACRSSATSGSLRQLGVQLCAQPGRRRRHLSPTPAQLRRRYAADGLTIRQLADLYGVSASTVRRWLRDAGIPRRLPGGHSQAPTREELCRLYQAEGLTTTQIGERYGVSQQTAHRWLRVAGVALRPRGRLPRASTGRP